MGNGTVSIIDRNYTIVRHLRLMPDKNLYCAKIEVYPMNAMNEGLEIVNIIENPGKKHLSAFDNLKCKFALKILKIIECYNSKNIN